MGLSTGEILSAFGIAGYSAQVPTLRRFFSKPQDAMTKYDHLGLATRNGLDAATLAKAGFTGDRTILEGPQAFWRLSGAEGCDWNYMTDGLGERWVTDDTRPKAFPVGVGSVTMLEALKDLIAQHGLKLGDVRHVTVRTTQSYVQKTLDVQTEIEAWTDLRYCVAAMFAGIEPYKDWYLPKNFLRPDIKAFMAKVSVEQLPRAREDGSARGVWAAAVEVRTDKGSVRAGRDVLTPMSDAALDAKFRDNISGELPARSADRLIRLCHGLENVASVREIGAALRRPGPPAG